MPNPHPQESAPLLKINLFGVASLTCEAARALRGPGYALLWGLEGNSGARNPSLFGNDIFFAFISYPK